MSDWFNDMFIDEAKPALDRHSGAGESINNQDKTITENGVYTADEGYSGLGAVTVDVEAPDPVLESLSVTENGTYTPDEGADGFNQVTVDVEQTADAVRLAELESKTDLYERYLRASVGESFQDWNPQPIDSNETATFEEAPEKYKITVETRGIEYTVNYDSRAVVTIYPEIEINRKTNDNTQYLLFGPNHPDLNVITGFDIVDMSRIKSNRPVWYYSRVESFAPVFVALAENTKFYPNEFCFNNPNSDPEGLLFSQGLSFGKSLSGMKAGSIYYSHLNNGDKPVFVMEGFRGDLYLSKLNISAEHLIGIINNLSEGSHTLNIGTTNMAKLTDEQILIATEKGWTVT